MVTLQPHGPHEMVKRDHHLHAVAADALGHLRVMRERGGIEFPALGFDPRPRHRETEQLAAHRGGGGDVLLVAVPEIRRLPARREALAALPQIPDILAQRIMRLHLVVGIGGAEEEALGKFQIRDTGHRGEITSAGKGVSRLENLQSMIGSPVINPHAGSLRYL